MLSLLVIAWRKENRLEQFTNTFEVTEIMVIGKASSSIWLKMKKLWLNCFSSEIWKINEDETGWLEHITFWSVNLAWDVYSNGSFNLEKYSSFIFSICLIHKIWISVFIPDWLLTSVLNLFFLLGYLKIPTMWYFSYILHIQGFWSEYLFPDCQTDVTPQKGKQVSSSLMPWFIRYFWTLLPRRTFIWIKFI